MVRGKGNLVRNVTAGLVLLLLAGCGTPTRTPTRPALALPTPTTFAIPTVAWTPTPRSPQPEPTPPETLPTATRPPSTPTRAAQVPYGWVRPLKARVRAAPSLDAEVITLLPAGTTLRLLGRTKDGAWYYVRAEPLSAPPVEGWMAAEVVVTFVEPERIPVHTP